MCKYYKMYGKCNYGDKCNFSHEEPREEKRYDDRPARRGAFRDDRRNDPRDDRRDYYDYDRRDTYDRRDDERGYNEKIRGSRGRGRGERGRGRGAPRGSRGRGTSGRDENQYTGYKFYDDGRELSESDYNDYRRDLGPKLKNPNKQERKNSDYYTDKKPADIYSDDSSEQVQKVWEVKPK